MTCEEFEQLSGAYALDAITPAERQAAEEHLATCTKCSRLVQELRGVVTLLPLSVQQINPPPALKERILAALQQGTAPVPVPPVRLRPSGRRQRWHPGILVAAAVLMFGLLGGMTAWNISLHNQLGALDNQLSLLHRQVSQFSQQTPISYQVKGTEVAAQAVGQLIYYRDQNITVLMVSGLPQLRGVHVYQGWLLHTQGKDITAVRSIGLLNTENGSASLSFPGNVTGYDATAVSLEPGPRPTPNAPRGNVVALGSLIKA